MPGAFESIRRCRGTDFLAPGKPVYGAKTQLRQWLNLGVL